DLLLFGQEINERLVDDAPAHRCALALLAQEWAPPLQRPLLDLIGRAADHRAQPGRRHRLPRRGQGRYNRAVEALPFGPAFLTMHLLHLPPELVVVALQAARQRLEVERVETRLARGDVGQDVVQVLEVPFTLALQE